MYTYTYTHAHEKDTHTYVYVHLSSKCILCDPLTLVVSTP